MKILITGGAGYIGSHTAKLAASLKHDLFILDNLSRGHEWATKWGKFIQEDLKNKAAVKKILSSHKIEAVIHFAAHSYVGESMKDPILYFRNNVINTLNLLEAMNEARVRTIVFSSTAATYGNPKRIPIPEDHEQAPVNPYGESKLFIEKALEWHGKAYGLRWSALRYFNAAGADPENEIGEVHKTETHLIPITLETLLGKRSHLDIYGTDYSTPDGTAIRDYIHVTDLADAHMRALEYLTQGGSSTAFNLGTGQGYSVRQVVETVEKVTGKKVPVQEASRRVGDPPSLVAQADKAKKMLNWEPKFSDLESIIKTAWQWHQKQAAAVK